MAYDIKDINLPTPTKNNIYIDFNINLCYIYNC